jgi:hypothetical protein
MANSARSRKPPSEQCAKASEYIDKLSRILSNLLNARFNYTEDWPKLQVAYKVNVEALKELLDQMTALLQEKE